VPNQHGKEVYTISLNKKENHNSGTIILESIDLESILAKFDIFVFPIFDFKRAI
jgi:hypothetical protein